MLLSYKVEHIPDRQGICPIIYAIDKGLLGILRLFFENKYGINAYYNNRTLLWEVVIRNNVKLAAFMLASGANVNRKFKKESLLGYSHAKGYYDMC